MDKHKIHITYHTENLAVPEVIVEDEDGHILTKEDLDETAEKKAPEEEAKAEADESADDEPEAEKKETEEENPHPKITPHVQYDTLAVPEITFEIKED